MSELPGSWVTIITLVLTAIFGGIGWLFIRQDAKLAASEERNKVLTDKFEQILKDRIGELKGIAENAEKRRETDEKLARSIDMNTSEIAAFKLKVNK